ncbi:MAG TPA: Gfo/Idh/MocA family oxidoreductase [Opitutaceae bacterium]
MTTIPPPLRWGILSTGLIAARFTRAFTSTTHGRVVAVGSRTAAAAERFAAEHSIGRAYGSYESLLADPEVQAVYVATPHPQHLQWALAAAAAGKHILCEKPIAMNLAQTTRMVAAARQHDVLLMEAFMYRCHPQTARVVELIRDGALGRVGLVQATFSFNAAFNPASRLWNNALGGGGILDVGGYTVSWARLVAGAAAGKSFLNPVRVTGAAELHPETQVDAYAAATLSFPNGVLGQVACGVGLRQESVVRIYGTEGELLLTTPYVPGYESERPQVLLRREGRAPETIVVAADRDLYAYEADAFAAALAAGERDVPAMTVADTLGNMAVLDAWRAEGGVRYAQDCDD